MRTANGQMHFKAGREEEVEVDRQLHGAARDALGRDVYQSALSLRQLQTTSVAKQDELKKLREESASLDATSGQTEGGFLGIGKSPTAAAAAARARLEEINPRIEELRQAGYGNSKNDGGFHDPTEVAEAKKSHRQLTADKSVWTQLAITDAGQLNDALSERRASIIAGGGDPSKDRVIQAIEAHKKELGIQAKPEDEHEQALRNDSTYGPILRQRDNFDAEVKPLEQVTNKLLARLESTLGLGGNMTAAGGDPDARLGLLRAYTDHVSDPDKKRQVQTLLTALEPRLAELRGTRTQRDLLQSQIGLQTGQMQKAKENHDTPLTAPEEAAFQRWKATVAPNDSGDDYDLRGAFRAGITPDPSTGHWPDTFKKPNHPTFSDQSVYAKDAPERAGHWDGDKFVPSIAQNRPLKAQLAARVLAAEGTKSVEAEEKIQADPEYASFKKGLLQRVKDKEITQAEAGVENEAFLKKMAGNITGDERTDLAIVEAKAGNKTYRVDENHNIQFQAGHLGDGLEQAIQDNLIDSKWAEEHRENFKSADKKYQELEKAAGSKQVLKALLHGAGIGGAFIGGYAAGSPPGAAIGAPIGAAIAGAVGAPTGPGEALAIPAGSTTGAAIGSVIGGLSAGTLAAFAARKGMEKLSEYSETIKSLTASAELHPVASSAGELLAFGGAVPKALSNTFRLARITGEAASDLGPAAARSAQIKTVAKTLGIAAATGATFETAIRPAFDAARYAAADVLGVKHEEFQNPSVKSILTNTALAVLLAGHSIKFKDYSAGDVASIMARAKIRNDAGIDLAAPDPAGVVKAASDAGIKFDSQNSEALTKPLTKQEIQVWEALRDKTKRMGESGAFDEGGGVKFTGAKQAVIPSLRGEGEPITAAGVEALKPGQVKDGTGVQSTEPTRISSGAEAATPPANRPTPEQAHAEIDALQASEQVKPEQVAVTQAALRGMVKIASGQPMDALTAAEKQALLKMPTEDGIPRVEMVKGPEGARPVITDAALARVRAIAPTVAQMLPENEESQRQAILSADKTDGTDRTHAFRDSTDKVSGGGGGLEKTGVSGEQPTFAVEVQNAKGETKIIEQPAATAEEAKSAVAKTIKPGEGLIRDVSQISQPGKKVSVASGEAGKAVDFVERAVASASEEKGSALTPDEDKQVRVVARVFKPQVERWEKAFEAVTVTSGTLSSGGAHIAKGGKELVISVPDVLAHAKKFAENKRHAANIVTEEAIHAVTVALEDRDPKTDEARGPVDLVKVYQSLPEKIRAAMKGAYKVKGASDYQYAHEFWRMWMQGDLELQRGNKIRLKGKFLQEQTTRAFVVENRKALATLLRFFRDMSGQLDRAKTGKDVIAEVAKAQNLIRSKVKEVDAHAQPASEKGERENVEHKNPVSSKQAPTRGPPTGKNEPSGDEIARGDTGTARADGRGRGEDAPAEKAVAGAVESATREELTPSAERPTSNVQRSTFNERGELSERLNLDERLIGHKSRVTQNGRTVEVVFVAQEAAAARPSHDAQGRAVKGYDQSLQPRDRSLPQYRKQAQNIASNLDFAQAAFFPETKTPATTADLGAPVMTLSGDTLIGNGREIGIRTAYEQGLVSARKYKAEFVRNAAAFGIDPAAVMAMKAPVLKRVLLDESVGGQPLSKDELVRFSQESNEGAAMASNATEVANRDASRITPGLLSLFDPNYALDSAKNAGFLTAYSRDVIRTEGANETNLNPSELARRVRAAVFTYAYGADETGRAALQRLAGDESDAGGKNITNALLTVAPIMARMRNDVATGHLFPGLDISPALTRAAQDISNALQSRPQNQSAKVALDGLLNQGSLFTGDQMEQAVLEFMVANRGKRTAIEQGLSNFAEAVYRLGSPNESELFGQRDVASSLELFERATAVEAIAEKTEQRALLAQEIREAVEPQGTLDLFGTSKPTAAAYAKTLPVAAKASKSALKAEMQKDFPELADEELALQELFELAHPANLKPEAEKLPLANAEVASEPPGAATERASAAVIRDFGEKIGGARKDLASSTGPKGEAKPVDNRPGWLKKYHVFEDANKPGVWAIGFSDGGIATRETFRSKAEAEKMVPLLEVARNHSVRQIGAATGISKLEYAITRELGPRKRPTVKGGFATREEAMAYMAAEPEAIINHKFAFPEKPWLDRIERTGPQVRTGNVAPAKFQETFGFRGGEFGNWNMGSDGQAALNHAYDGLIDLADALGVDPKALSLNGDLAIAFGARGHGLQSASAHYERDYAVINLTKIKGAGSAGHEWFHAFDHYLARQDTKASSGKTPVGTFKTSASKSGDYVSHGFGYKSQVREDLRTAFKSLMEAMVRKNVTGEIDKTIAEKNDARMNEHVQSTLADLRRSFDSHYKRNRSTGTYDTERATPEELARFDAVAEKIARGDVGEKRVVEGKGRMNYRQSYQAIEDLNAIYKEVTGRSFATAADGSTGKQLYWQINSMRDARERLEKASEGVTEVKSRVTNYYRESRKIDDFRASDYWSTPHEMGARSFEAFVNDKLSAAGRRSDYLVHGADNRFYVMLGMKPYPEGEERTVLNTAWQRVFDTVQQKTTEKGVALYSQPTNDPLFEQGRPLAAQIAKRYANIRGVDSDDVQQRALSALARAAERFDASRGPFLPFARTAINNELRGMYRASERSREDTSLDAPIANDEGQMTNVETQKDRLIAPSDTRSDVELAESRRVLDEMVAELPARMQGAISGILDGETLEAIGQSLGGISRQAVGRLATEAMRRLSGKLGERGITSARDLLAQAITPDGKQPQDYKRSSTQVTLSKEKARPFIEFGKTIPKNEIFTDPDDPTVGLYDEPHITALYGITQASPNATAKAVLAQATGPITATIGKLSMFKTPKYDVLKADIDSPQLHAINAALRAAVPFENDFPDYKPHLTIAYLKHGEAAKYVGDNRFDGTQLSFSELDFRSKDGRKFSIALQQPFARAVSVHLDFTDAIIQDTLKAQSSADPLQQLIDSLDADALDTLLEKAMGEERGKFETGRPDLALGAGASRTGDSAAQRATDQYYTDLAKVRTRETMAKEAEQILADFGSVNEFAQVIANRWLNGDTLRDSEVMAAKTVLSELSRQTDTPEGVRKMMAAAYAYRNIRGQTARDLAAGFDPHKTPEERNREFLAKAISTLPPKVEKRIAAEPDPEKRAAMLDAAMSDRLEKLEKAFAHLSKGGLTLEDVLGGGWELHGKGAKMIENEMAGLDVPRQKALKLAQNGARTAKEIAQATGLSEAEVERVNDQFISSLRDKLREKVRAGLTLEKIDLQGALLAQEAGADRPVGTNMTDEAVNRELERIIRGMGFVAAKDLGKFKVVKRKRPKLFVPPAAPYLGRVLDDSPVPFEERRQNQLPFTEEHAMRNVNPKPGDQVTEPPGRVLGQIGLPLYQEMMVRRGADMGSVDDVVKIARVMQATNGNAFDMVYEAWINGILSGPQTHVANITGNLASTALDFTLQRGMEALVNLVYRDADSAQLGEFKHIARGIIPGLQRGLSLAIRAWDAESDFFRNEVLNEQVEMFEDFDKGGGVPPAIPGRTGRVVRMPGRSLLFMDADFKGLIGQMEVAAQSYRIAKKEGLTGQALEERMNELMATPGSEAWLRAADKTRYLTFQDPILTSEEGGGVFDNAVARFNQARAGTHLLGYFFPFIRTPYNIFKVGLRKTPLGTIPMLNNFARAGFYRIRDVKPVFESYSKARQVRDIAEQLIAWTVFGALWAATTGDDDDDKKPILLIGSTPYTETKKGERELYQRAYGGPYQLRIGGRNGIYLNYGRYEPIATVLGTVVDAITNLKKIKHGQTFGQTLDAMHGYFLAQAQSKTFLQGFGTISEVLRGQTSVSQGVRKALLEGLVPNLIRQPLRNLDDYVRSTKDASAAYQMFPASGLAEPRIDVYGRPVAKAGNAFSRLFFASGTEPYSELKPADKLLLNWNKQNPQATWGPTLPAPTYKGADGKPQQMTAVEARKFYEASGKRAEQMLRGQFDAKAIEHPTEADKNKVQDIFEEAHRLEKAWMFGSKRSIAPPQGKQVSSVNVIRAWKQAA